MATIHGLMVTLPQMVDLSIGSPEVGAVNFNILHAVLHVLIQQAKLTEHLVEYRGLDKERIDHLLHTAAPGMSIRITEINPHDGKEPRSRRFTEDVEKEVKELHPKKNLPLGPSASSRVLIVEPSEIKSTYHIPQIVAGLSQNYIDQITDDIEDLKNKMDELLNLPKNATIINAMRKSGTDTTKPVYDMWHALNLSKRVDAIEVGLEKLTSIVEDLIQDMVGADSKPAHTPTSKKSVSTTISDGNRLKAGGEVVESDTDDKLKASEIPRKRTNSFFSTVFNDIAARLDTIEQRILNLEGKMEEAGDIDGAAINKELANLKKQIKSYGEDFGTITQGCEGKNLGDLLKEIDLIKEQCIKEVEQETGEVGLEKKLSTYDEKICNLDENFSAQINKLQSLYIELETELSAALEKLNAKDEAVDALSMTDMYNKMMKIQDEMEAMRRNSDQLKDELVEKQMTIDVLVEQIEVLKTSKADREDLEDALADKADAQIVNRKVSVNQFDATCDDITRSIETTMNKLTQQEDLWKLTLEDLQATIGMKLDKGEFDPLKDFVNRKIKALQDRLKALIALRQEQEAAGTKHKLLKDVNCISCDRNVIMQRENKFPTFATSAALPGTRSIKPYITYELDAVRKQQKILPGGRNMNHLENALQDKIPTRDRALLEKPLPPGHLCNRYCGGSHTMTLPQQRVAHVGHFLTQWGPQAISLEESQILGNDGQIYKSRDPPLLPPKEISSQKVPSKLSACMQTDDISVPRMSSALLKAPSKKRVQSIQILVPKDGLQSIREEDELNKDDQTSKISFTGKKARKSSLLITPSRSEQSRSSISKIKKDSSKSSVRKNSVSLKRMSHNQVDRTSTEEEQVAKAAAHIEEEIVPRPEEGEIEIIENQEIVEEITEQAPEGE